MELKRVIEPTTDQLTMVYRPGLSERGMNEIRTRDPTWQGGIYHDYSAYGGR